MRAMKDSGVEWIGELPADWDVIKNKYLLLNIYSGGTPKATNNDFYCEDNGVPFVSISDMSNVQYVYTTKKYLTEQGIEDKNLKILPKETILYSIYATIGAISELKVEATISQAILALNVNEKINKNFYKYNLISMKDYVHNETNGNTQFNLNAEKVRNFYFAFPPLHEQQRIADYLDKKCAEIDAIISKQHSIIEKLQEYKLSLITETVTKGLNADAEMKDSGIEWIGEIPKHWDLCKLKHIGYLQNGISKGGEYFGYGYPFVSYGDVYKNISLPFTVEGLIDSTEEERFKYSVQEGDIFFTRTSETIEEVGFSAVCEKTIPEATFAGFLIRLRPYNEIITKEYAKYYFRSNHHRVYLVKEMNLVTRASLGQNLLKNMIVLLPPKEEQYKIADFLNRKCAGLEKIISDKLNLILKLTEYKKSLIYEVVTGKKEV